MSFFVIIRGPMGSGKTTISKKLSNILNAKYFSVDKILDEHNLSGEWEEGYIAQKNFKKVNEIITPKSRGLLEMGLSTVFDGNFYWRSQVEDLISRLDFLHFVFTLKAPLDVCIERDKSRSKNHGVDATKSVYKKSIEFDYGIVINAEKSVEECIEEIISYLPKS